jgi:alpha-D-ribose 1-methylphosphonate 5-triphosphate synthase subunit PhnH
MKQEKLMLKLDAIWQADNQQKQFRLLLEAMSRPGKCYDIAAIPEHGSVALSVLATLLDAEVSLADPHGLLCKDDWPMLQTRPASPDQADYILCDGDQVLDVMPKLGTLKSPEQSATLIIVVKELGLPKTGQCVLNLKLTGPGVASDRLLSVIGLHNEWLSNRLDWNSSFPLGVDMIMIDSDRITAIPRTTKVELL